MRFFKGELIWQNDQKQETIPEEMVDFMDDSDSFVIEEKNDAFTWTPENGRRVPILHNNCCLFEEFNRDAAVFFVDHSWGSRVCLGCILFNLKYDENDVLSFMENFLKFFKLQIATGTTLQVTEAEMMQLLNDANLSTGQKAKMGFNTLSQFSRVNLNSLMSEYIIRSQYDEKCLIKEAESSDCSYDLLDELRRIFEAAKMSEVTSNRVPVHYIVRGGNEQELQKTLSVLTKALQISKRIRSRHVYLFNCDYNRFRITDECINIDSLAPFISGNYVAIEYKNFNVTREEAYESQECFELLCRGLFENRFTTQVIFLIPDDDEASAFVKQEFPVPFITIGTNRNSSSVVDAELLDREAKRRSEKDAVNLDKSFYDILAIKQKQISESPIQTFNSAYDEWFHTQVIATEFKQYEQTIQNHFKDITVEDLSASNSVEKAFIGQTKVKKQISSIISRLKLSKYAEKEGISFQRQSLHMAFVGSPGTGKTMVARLYANALKDLGVIKHARVVEVTGNSVNRRLWERIKGCVVFIDEAYTMLPSDLADLISFMENNRNDTAVILAGYNDGISGLFEMNEGLRSRIGAVIEFSDYSADELVEIFQFMANASQIKLEPKALSRIGDVLHRPGRRRDQGNARYVRNLFENSCGNMQERLAQELIRGTKLTKDDFRYMVSSDIANGELEETAAIPSKNQKVLSPSERLNRLIGLQEAKQCIDRYLRFCVVDKLRRERGLCVNGISMHMAFVGNPGTGKTEVASLIAGILREKGVLSVGRLVKKSASDLIGPLPSITDKNITNRFEEARGSVLFIDEAYILSGNSSAITVLIEKMESYRAEVIVILAGYTNAIQNLLHQNDGFSSRVPNIVKFEDYSKEELVQIAQLMLESRDYRLNDEANRALVTTVSKMYDQKDEYFGNAREMRNLVEKVIVKQSERLCQLVDAGKVLSDVELSELIVEDFDIEANRSSFSKSCPIGFCA